MLQQWGKKTIPNILQAYSGAYSLFSNKNQKFDGQYYNSMLSYEQIIIASNSCRLSPKHNLCNYLRSFCTSSVELLFLNN